MEFELKASGSGVTAKFVVAEAVNEEDNTSTLSIQMFLKSSLWMTTYFLDGSIASGGNAINFDPTDDECYGYIGALNSYNEVKQSPFSLTVTHNPDGTGPAIVDVNIKGTTRSGGAGSGWRITGTLEVPLTTIPRASTISSTADVVFGGPCSVKWTPASASFKFKLGFSIGDWSHTTDYIEPNTTEPFVYSGYTIPYEAAEQIPNEKSGRMGVVLYTYSGDNLVGEANGDMEATLLEDEDTKPTVTIESITAVTALDSPLDELFIQGQSKAEVTFSGAGKHGASVSGYSVTLGAVSQSAVSPFTTQIINDYGTVSIVVTATDSRGFSASVTEQIEVLGYAKPKLVPVDGEAALVCARCTADGTVDTAGTALLIKAKKAYSGLDGNNSCKLLLQYKLASEDDSEYSDPYELIGEVVPGGKNLFDLGGYTPSCNGSIDEKTESFVVATGTTTTGGTLGDSSWSNGWLTFDNLGIGSNTYTLSYTLELLEQVAEFDFAGKKQATLVYDSTGVAILTKITWITNGLGTYQITATFTSDVNKIVFSLNNCKCRVSNIQLELGTVATEYEPYQPPKVSDSYAGVFDEAVFDKTARYTIKLTAEDLVDSTLLTFTVMSDKIYAHRGEDFLALGGYTEKGGFESFWSAHFHQPAHFLGDVYIGDMTLDDYIKKSTLGG